MQHLAACVWCGLITDAASVDGAQYLIREHIFKCSEGPVGICLDLLEKCSTPETVTKAKELIQCRLTR